MRAFRFVSAALLTTFAVSCGGSSAPQTAAAPAAAPAGTAASSDPTALSATSPTKPAARQAFVITREELDDPTLQGRDAKYIIQQLRPAFFISRGPRSLGRGNTDASTNSGALHISQDFGPLQLASALENMEMRNVIEVRYLNSEEAQQRFGINANGGPVIVLLTTK